MNVEYYKELSHELNRDMEFKVYGHTGIPCLVFPRICGIYPSGSRSGYGIYGKKISETTAGR